jgi:hypothetical protein
MLPGRPRTGDEMGHPALTVSPKHTNVLYYASDQKKADSQKEQSIGCYLSGFFAKNARDNGARSSG